MSVEIHEINSRKGNCLDNAVIENFFGLLKSELLYLPSMPAIHAISAIIQITLLRFLCLSVRRSVTSSKNPPPI